MKTGLLLCILILLKAPSAFAGLMVMTNIGTRLSCESSSGMFWGCDGGRVLFLPNPQIGQLPTLHQIDLKNVEVPVTIENLEIKKTIFINKSHFQYQKNPDSAEKSYYRKFNLMMGFEPALRSCHLAACRTLHQKIFSDRVDLRQQLFWNQQIQNHADKAFANIGTSDRVDFEELSGLNLQYRLDKKLRYDYLLDGCFARAHLVAQDLQAKGYAVMKIWAYGFGLWTSEEIKPLNFFGWRYHVAPVVKVNNSFYVIEPGFFSRPTQPFFWLQNISGPNIGFVFDNAGDENTIALQKFIRVSFTDIEVYPEPSAGGLEMNKYQKIDNAKEILNDLPYKK